jgi:hypothetical protein
MFGYRVEQNFDLAKEQRRDRLYWIIGGGIALLCVLYVFHPFPAAVFQGYFLTSICYGESFFVRRRDRLARLWLWKAISATIPLHLLLLLGIIYLGLPSNPYCDIRHRGRDVRSHCESFQPLGRTTFTA